MRVIVTRPRAQARPLVGRLEALGDDVVECPLIEIERTSDEPIDAPATTGLIVTSPNGADEIAAARTQPAGESPPSAPGTAEALRAHGIEPAFVPRESSQDGTAARVSTSRPAGCSSPPQKAPAAARSTRSAPTSSRSTARGSSTPHPPEGDVVVLASGSAARAYAGIGGAAPAVSIGPETTRVAAGRRPRPSLAEAATHDLDGLVAAVRDLMKSAP